MTGSKEGLDVPVSSKPTNPVNGLSNKLTGNDINMDGSKENPEDVPASTTKPANGGSPELADKSNYIDLCESEGGTEGALASTESVSNKDGVVQAGDVMIGDEEEFVLSSKPVQSVGFSNGDDMILVDKSVNHLGNNTASNACRSTQEIVAALKKIKPVWSISQHKHRSAAFVSIPGPIWKKFKPFKDSSVIQGVSNKFKVLWDEFNEVEYNSNTPIFKIMEFIDCLVKKKGDWTKSHGATKVLNEIFVSLSKTSPKVFFDN